MGGGGPAGARRRAVVEGRLARWALLGSVCVGCCLGCASATDSPPPDAALTSQGGSGQGVSDQNRAGTGSGGDGVAGDTFGVEQPATAERCDRETLPFVSLQAWEWNAEGDIGGLGTTELEAHVLGSGVGWPEELAGLPLPAAGEEQLGWLRLGDIPLVDAGLPLDGGALPPPPPVLRWTIVGPRELSLIAASSGERVRATIEPSSGPSYNPPRAHLRVELDGQVVLYQHVQEIGAAKVRQDGFTFERAPARCYYDDVCWYQYQHPLVVTAPGGASAVLNPGSAQTLGDYLVIHGVTGSKDAQAGRETWEYSNGTCADRWATPSQLTAIRVSRPD
jgi:hypothetical protein